MSLKADVYQLGGNRWYWIVYDTDRPMRPLAKGRAEKHEWATALLDARSALQRLHLKALQDRVNAALLRSVSRPIAPQRFWLGMPKTWEGDYA